MNVVQKLRSPAAAFYEYAADEGALLREAAGRIEALEAEVERLMRERDEARARVALFHYEVERLREERDAYRQAIEDYFSNSATHWPADSSQAEEVERFAVRALRAALEEAEGT